MRLLFIVLACFYCFSLNSQIIPSTSNYNEGIVWESVFTEGPSGKVNRGIVDSQGNCVVVFMPDDITRVHKINGNTGELIWSININNKVGFGVSELVENNQIDYILSGGSGNSQERWIARINGDTGTIIWDRTYNYDGKNGEYDGVRMTCIGSDGFIYGSGFVNGDESGTIFVVYAGSAMIIKVDPSNGDEIWTYTNNNSEYALACVESSDNYIFFGGVEYEQGLSVTKLSLNGIESWTHFIEDTEDVIPYDLDIDNNDHLYYGGHTGREGAGDPFDYSCISLNTDGNTIWMKNFANPRGYSTEHIRNELYGIQAGSDGVYLFGGSGDESNYSAINPPFPSSDVWVGWVLALDFDGEIIRSDVFCHEDVNSATEYGYLIENGYVIFNDTDSGGDTEVGVMKIINGSNPNISSHNNEFSKSDKKLEKIVDALGRDVEHAKNQILFHIFDDGTVEKKFSVE
tara:strand:- start:306 stop:1682 length:1377 start_codon:yes stop_codon:yes gene_type:complete